MPEVSIMSLLPRRCKGSIEVVGVLVPSNKGRRSRRIARYLSIW
jgi:hypothetical protein